MGKPRKSRKNRFDYNKDRRKAWKKSKKLPAIPCEPIKKAWDERKSAAQNLLDMGLSADPNKTLGLKQPKGLIDKRGITEMQTDSTRCKAEKSHVAAELEEEANQPHISTMKFSDPVVQFCVYMMNKYGEDYKAMARDPRNYYQDTPKQIRRKIMSFKNTPVQYKAYLSSLEGCITPVKKTLIRPAEKSILPRRRMPTRGFEAGSRNGHFVSVSPFPNTSSFATARKMEDLNLAARVRVRRRLKFGRKPPKPRVWGDPSTDVKEAQSNSCSPHEKLVIAGPRSVAMATDGQVIKHGGKEKLTEEISAKSNCKVEILLSPRTTTFLRKTPASTVQDCERNCTVTCSKTRMSRRKLDVSDSGSINKLEETDSFREI